jgi:hypothetical protein
VTGLAGLVMLATRVRDPRSLTAAGPVEEATA